MERATQLHLIRVTVNVKNVKLFVRFPCKLSFQLKYQHQASQTKTAYQLKKGECQVNEILCLQIQAEYNPNTHSYLEQMVKLTVMMSSNNGYIPAGSVIFNACSRQTLQRVDYILPLQKCPDRSSQITFIQSFQFVRNIGSANNFQSSISARQPKINKVDMKYSVVSNTYQRQKSPIRDIRDISNNSKYGNIKRDVSSHRNRVKTVTDINHEDSYPTYQYQSNRHAQNQHYFHKSQVIRQEDSYVRDNQQKSHYLKEIAKLKGQLKSYKNQDKWDHVIRIKDQNQQLLLQIQKVKDKNKTIQRKEKQYNSTIKQQRQEIQRSKNKLIQTEQAKSEIEIAIRQKQKYVKQLTFQLNQCQQKIQDMSVSHSSLLKRVEFKEASFQQQTLKINQKYSQTQTQRQKAIFQYNSLLTKYQQSQKRNQLVLKQKQRTALQEKNRLNKRVQSLCSQNEQIHQQLQDKKIKIIELSKQLKQLAKKYQDNQQHVTQLESNLNFIQNSLKKQESNKIMQQKQIQGLKIIENQRNLLKKKLSELLLEEAKLHQKIERLHSQGVEKDHKFKQLTDKYIQRNQQKNIVSTKLNSLKKELQDLKKQQQKKCKDAETLSVQNFNLNQKLNQFRSKLQFQKRQFQESQNAYEEQISYLIKAKQYVQNQLQQYKWSNDKLKTNFNDATLKLKEANDQILKLNEEIMKLTQKAKRAQQQFKQLKNTQQKLKNDKFNLESKQKQINQAIKQKNQKIHTYQKKIQQIQQELFMTAQKIKQMDTYFKDKSSTDQKQIKQKQKNISNKGQELAELQLEIMEKTQQIITLTQQLNTKTHQNTFLKDSLQNQRNQLNSKQIKFQQICKELRASKAKNQSLLVQVQKLQKQIQNLIKQRQNIFKDWQIYKKQSNEAFQQFFDQISKDQDFTNNNATKESLLRFPENHISALQIQALKKRKILNQKHTEEVLLLKEENAILNNQLEKHKNIIQQAQLQIQRILTNQKNKLKQISIQNTKERQQYTQTIKKLEDSQQILKGQVERNSNEIQKLRQIIQQLDKALKQSKKICQQIDLQRRELQDKIIQLKTNQIQFKSTNQYKLVQINEQNNLVIQKLKQLIYTLEKKIIQDQKIIMQKQEETRKNEVKINEITYEKQRNQQKCIQINQKMQALAQQKKQMQKKIKAIEKEIKDKLHDLSNRYETINNQKQKYDQIKKRYNSVYEDLTVSQIQSQKIKQDFQKQHEKATQLQSNLKEKSQKWKYLLQKCNNQIRQLKQKVINLNSEIQLKGFIISQNQTALNFAQKQKQSIQVQLQKRKNQILCQQNQLQTFKNEKMYANQQTETLKSQNQSLMEQAQRYKQKLSCIQIQLAQYQFTSEVLQFKQKQIVKMKDELYNNRRHYEKTIQQLKISISNESTSRNSRQSKKHEQEYRKRISQLERLLQLRNYDLAEQRKRIIYQIQKQFKIQNKDLVQMNMTLKRQLQRMNDKKNKQIDALNNQISQISFQLISKEQAKYNSNQNRNTHSRQTTNHILHKIQTEEDSMIKTLQANLNESI